jgi:TPP-dependent indolepyruvate ferredoxin oxidoreductase alpha subunit
MASPLLHLLENADILYSQAMEALNENSKFVRQYSRRRITRTSNFDDLMKKWKIYLKRYWGQPEEAQKYSNVEDEPVATGGPGAIRQGKWVHDVEEALEKLRKAATVYKHADSLYVLGETYLVCIERIF